MITQRPDNATLNSLVALGRCADHEPCIADLLRSLTWNPYIRSVQCFHNFEWLCELSWEDACAVVRAVVRAEAAKLTRSGGSASSVKSAFRTMENRDRVAAMELAAWIADNTDNDYIPFPMRKTRYAFESIKETAISWEQCREELDRWNDGESARLERVTLELANHEREVERRREIKRAVETRLRAERAEMHELNASTRRRLLAELGALPVRERLEHIAWDDTRTLTFYPAEFAACSAEELGQLDLVTKARFTAKLQARRNGPWRELAKRLGLKR